jgi:hypothetical protein
MQGSQHLGDLLVLAIPSLERRLVDVIEIFAISDPHLHFFAGSDGHDQKTLELGTRVALLAETFNHISADRFTGPPDLIRQAELLDLRKCQ